MALAFEAAMTVTNPPSPAPRGRRSDATRARETFQCPRPPARRATLGVPPLRKPPQQPLQALQQVARLHATLHAQLKSARAQHDVESLRLGFVRKENLAGHEAQLLARIHELLSRELEPSGTLLAQSFPKESGTQSPVDSHRFPPTELAQGTLTTEKGSASTSFNRPGAPAPHPQVPPTSKAETFVSLVRKIETLARGQQPALALKVGGRINGEVIVERTGPNEVGVTLRTKDSGRRGPLLDELRAALTTRGLRLSALKTEALEEPDSRPA